MTTAKSTSPQSAETCEHGLHWLPPAGAAEAGERVCALEYLNRFVAPKRVEQIRRRGAHLYLVFDSGEKLECCCESCGESHGDDPGFTDDIREVALGRRALRFRLESESGHLVVWFARGDHLHLHRNALVRFHPSRASQPSPGGTGRRTRSVRPTHTPPADK